MEDLLSAKSAIHFVVGMLAFAGMFVMSTTTVYASPPAPIVVTLPQPDGTTFQARAWGDEWSNGMETIAGYTILLDLQSNYWVYAAPTSDSKLAPAMGTEGKLVVGRDDPGGLPKHIRPTRTSIPTQEVPLQSPSSGPNLTNVNTGTQKILVILVAFQNRGPVGTVASDWNDKFFGPTGSVRQYYNEVSYGNLTLAPAEETSGTANDGVVGWLTLPYNHPNTSGNLTPANLLITRDAILAADPFVNFAAFDTNGDGYISFFELHVVIVAAGYEAAYGASNTCSPSVWAHEYYLGADVGVAAPTVDGKKVASSWGNGGYTQFGEWDCELGDMPGHAATIGVMAHELGHDLGLPDLYDVDGDTEGIGRWGIMGSGGWNRSGPTAYYGDSPAHPDPWSRWFEGWLTPVQVTSSTLAKPIQQIETNPTVYQLLDNPRGVDWVFESNSGVGEYYLVENRQQVGFDVGLPGCGLLIWHIDESVYFDNSANADQNHRLVDLKQADGLNSLDIPNGNRGDAGDPFPGSSVNRTFNLTSNPNSNLYSGIPSGVSVTNIGDCNSTMTANLFVPSFSDVPPTDWAWKWIEALSASGVTNGCGEGNYCPQEAAARSQMAVLLLRAKNGSGYTPPPATGVFADVPADYWAANWIEQLYTEGITKGCGSDPLSYCPDSNVTRAQMAIFLLRAKYGNSYSPPPATGLFADVPIDTWAANWIEQLYTEGITTGCGTAPLLYCPDGDITRAEVAVFLARTFNLPLP
jgi:M6 family metalloprotease-like protein